MSRMGVFDYYFGFDTVMDKFATLEWCSIYTTSKKIHDTYGPLFKKPIILLDTITSDSMLNGKLNRMKTIEIQRIEKIMKDEGYKLAAPEEVQDAQIPEEFQDIVGDLRATDEHVVVMNETNFTLSNIIDSLQLSKTIVYLPSTSKLDILNRLRGFVSQDELKLDTRKRIDFLFAQKTIKLTKEEAAKKYVSPAFQYMYEIDLEQPMLIRSHNYVIKKLFSMLENINDLQTIFKKSYQFLSRLRMTELRPVKLPKKSKSVDQEGGAEFETDNYEEEEDDLDFLYGPRKVNTSNIASGGGAQRRQKFSYRRRERGEKLKRRGKRMSFRRRYNNKNKK